MTEMTSDATSDEPYYYRVDNLESLRAMRGARDFLPGRWDVGPRPWQHVSLLKARETLAAGHGIFRMSFWQRQEPADRELQGRGWHRPLALLRVKRSAVRQALAGWHFEEDDFLRGDADLIWAVQEVVDHEGRFGVAGVPLTEFEVWDGAAGRWAAWHEARALLPDSTRLPAAGWFATTLRTRQAGAVLGYWKLLPGQGSSDPSFWLLLTLDDAARVTLGSEGEAIAAVVQDLMAGALGALQPEQIGVLTVAPTTDRLWMEQFAFTAQTIDPRGAVERLVRRHAGTSPWRLEARPHGWANKQRLVELLRTSALPAIKTEFPAETWAGDNN